MNNYSIFKVIEAMENEIKDCFRDIVRESLGGSVDNLKQNLFDDIWRDKTIFEVIERYLKDWGEKC